MSTCQKLVVLLVEAWRVWGLVLAITIIQTGYLHQFPEQMLEIIRAVINETNFAQQKSENHNENGTDKPSAKQTEEQTGFPFPTTEIFHSFIILGYRKTICGTYSTGGTGNSSIICSTGRRCGA